MINDYFAAKKYMCPGLEAMRQRTIVKGSPSRRASFLKKFVKLGFSGNIFSWLKLNEIVAGFLEIGKQKN